MKSFYSAVVPVEAGSRAIHREFSPGLAEQASGAPTYVRARIAVYDALSAAPRVEDIAPAPVGEFIEALSVRVHEIVRSLGGSIPFTVIHEIAENFIHANFTEPVVSVLDDGSTIRFADQGPGISDKARALLPGFTTASGEMKRYIRGVGSGLPIVREYLAHSGGSLAIEDNLGAGSVVTIYSRGEHPGVVVSPTPVTVMPRPAAYTRQPERYSAGVDEPSLLSGEETVSPMALPKLTTRQQHVLALVLETGLAGPSLVSKELGVAISTAYRDLASLEELGLISAESGKRTLTTEGMTYLGTLMNR